MISNFIFHLLQVFSPGLLLTTVVSLSYGRLTRRQISDSYGAPQGPVIGSGQETAPISDGYGAPQAPVIGGASGGGAPSRPSYNGGGGGGAPSRPSYNGGGSGGGRPSRPS